MEKNRIRSVKSGRSMRMSYQRQQEVLEMPNLIEVQKDSYQWFLDEGLKEVFDDISPINDFGGKLSLEFIDFTYDEKDAKYSIEECKERDVTYSAPLKVRVRLINKETEEINEHEIFMGDLPLMTATGTFVINGAERVIVSQLVRSPGIYYAIAHDKLGKRLFSSTVIPNRGAWLEYETDSNDVFYVRVDRTRKVPITVLIRALGVGSNAEIVEMFGEEPKILASFSKDTSTNYQEGLLELYKKIRPGEPLAVENAESLIMAMFFDPRRYDLAKVGRYKFNKKLHLSRRITGHILAEDVVDPLTGEVLGSAGQTVTKEMATAIQNGMDVRDLQTLQLAYAPPYGSAKDAVNMAGYMAENLSDGIVKQFYWDEVDALPRDGSVILLDVRTPREYARGHFDGAINIPVDELRDRMDEIERGKPIYVNCQSAIRSYIACRILSQNGFDCYNFAGGWRLYDVVMRDAEAKKTARPCGME